MTVGKALTYGAGGAAAGSVFGPIGAGVGGVLGGVFGALSGDEAPPPVAAPNAYGGVDPGAYGGLPVNYGAGPSQGTQAAAGQLQTLQQQMQAELDAAAQNGGTGDPARVAALQQQLAALQQQRQQMVQAGAGAHGGHQADAITQQIAALQQQLATAQSPQAGADAIKAKYGPQIQALQSQVQNSYHQDQLQTLQQNGTAVQGRQAPVVGAGPSDVPVDWGQSPVMVQLAQHALQTGTNGTGQPITPQERQLAQQLISQYQTQANQANPQWVAQKQSSDALALGAQNQAADRAQQGQLIGTLQDAAAGRGPSAALATLEQGRDANINQAQSMANSVRGGSGAQALGQRSALMAGAQATQQTANQAAILRANEMNNAYNTLGQALSSQRAGDASYNQQNIGVAGQNASMAGQMTSQNDAQTQYWNNLYYQAQQGDRDAAMQLQQLNSQNYNATINPGVAAQQSNQSSAYQQQQRGDAQAGNILNAIGTAGQAFKQQNGGGGSYNQPGPAYITNGGTVNANGGDGTWDSSTGKWA